MTNKSDFLRAIADTGFRHSYFSVAYGEMIKAADLIDYLDDQLSDAKEIICINQKYEEGLVNKIAELRARLRNTRPSFEEWLKQAKKIDLAIDPDSPWVDQKHKYWTEQYAAGLTPLDAVQKNYGNLDQFSKNRAQKAADTIAKGLD